MRYSRQFMLSASLVLAIRNSWRSRCSEWGQQHLRGLLWSLCCSSTRRVYLRVSWETVAGITDKTLISALLSALCLIGWKIYYVRRPTMSSFLLQIAFHSFFLSIFPCFPFLEKEVFGWVWCWNISSLCCLSFYCFIYIFLFYSFCALVNCLFCCVA